MMCLVTSMGTRIHSKHKIPLTVNGWCIWNSTKGGFNRSNTVANSQQSAIIQSALLLIILFQEEQAAAEAKTAKRHVPGRERQSKAEEWLCPTNCGFLWCPLWCLTTLMITLCVFTLCSPSLNHRTSATFSNVIFPCKQLSLLLQFCLSFLSQLFCPSHYTAHKVTHMSPHTGLVSWCLPYSLHMLSRHNGCLMICLHRSCRELFRFELRRGKGNKKK